MRRKMIYGSATFPTLTFKNTAPCQINDKRIDDFKYQIFVSGLLVTDWRGIAEFSLKLMFLRYSLVSLLQLQSKLQQSKCKNLFL
jgi:hypothetical protein